ncbi:MAG: MBL fold metallo-hydrolase [Planctomycetota bacterium]|nr:MBL fold metallo-hydrolase [Planctomycetota bacterium]
MKITWFGHAAFSIEGVNPAGEAVKLILDPYNYPECGGYLPIDEEADIVSISHHNERYHSDLSTIKGDYELFDALEHVGGSRTCRGVELAAFEVYETEDKEGPNSLVKFELEGITVAHQGDLGHAPEGEALEFLRGTDVLLALAGGPPTIKIPDLAELVTKTRVPLVLPMHYKTPKVNLDLQPVEDFLEACSGYPIETPGSTELIVTRDTLPAATTIIVLDHAR